MTQGVRSSENFVEGYEKLVRTFVKVFCYLPKNVEKHAVLDSYELRRMLSEFARDDSSCSVYRMDCVEGWTN